MRFGHIQHRSFDRQVLVPEPGVFGLNEVLDATRGVNPLELRAGTPGKGIFREVVFLAECLALLQPVRALPDLPLPRSLGKLHKC